MLIFISSTIFELEEERKAADEVIGLLNLSSFRSECFVASSQTPKDLCISKASKCNVFVGIYKNNYGTVPTEDNEGKISIPEMEFEASLKNNIPQIILEFHDDSQREYRLKKFLEKISNFTNGRFRKKYKNVEDLKYNLLASLIFEILKLDSVLDVSSTTHLRSLIEEELKYREFISKIHKYVDTKGFPPHEQLVSIELESLFIQPKLIPVSTFSDIDDFHSEIEHHNDEITEDALQRMELSLNFPFFLDDFYRNKPNDKKRILSLENIIYGSSKIVILGTPGIGKSSLLKSLLLKVLNEKRGLFPTLVSIEEYSLALKKNNEIAIISYIDQKYQENKFSNNFISKHLEAGSCIIMFDGLDEVSEVNIRKLVSRKIEEFSARFGKNNMIIVTSRFLGYRDAPINGFDHFAVSRFTKEQIIEFIDRWYQLFENNIPNNSDKTEACELFKHKLVNSKTIFELAKTPLFLTLLCILNRNGITPSRKVDLFKSYIDTLVESWDQNKTFNAKFRSFTSTQIRDAIKKVAFWFHENGKLKATRYEIETFLQKDTVLSGSNNSEEVVKDLLNTINERTGIILESNNEFQFRHKSILHYLAALQISDHPIPEIYSFLFNRLNIYRNCELIPLVASILNQQSIERSDSLINQIMEQRNKYENLTHFDLMIVILCIAQDIQINLKLKDKILNEIHRVLRENEVYKIESFNKIVAKLIPTSYTKDIVYIISDFMDISPVIVLDILNWYEYDLNDFENIVKKCYDLLIRSNPQYLINFIKSRLKKRDMLAIKLAKDLLLDDISLKNYDKCDRTFVQNKNCFSDLLDDNKKHEENRLQEKQQEETLKWRYISRIHTFDPTFLFPKFSATDLLESETSISHLQMSKLISLLNTPANDLYLFDSTSIFKSKRSLMTLLYMNSIQHTEIKSFLNTMLESDDWKVDVMKLYYVSNEGKLPSYIIFKIEKDPLLKEAFDNYEFVAKGFSFLRLITAVFRIMEFCLFFCSLGSIINKKFVSEIGSIGLEELLQLIIKLEKTDKVTCFCIIDLLQYFTKNGDYTMIGPISGMMENVEFTENQKQLMDLIDSSCELDPRLSERDDAKDEFDPDLFNRLKTIIIDNNVFSLFRENALEIYCKKFKNETTIGFLRNLLNDPVLSFRAAMILIGIENSVQTIDDIIASNKLAIEQKKLLLESLQPEM